MSETPPPGAPRKRLDERVAPGWANLCTNLLRGGGGLVGAVLIWLGFLTGGFFLALTGVLGAIAIIGGWWLGGLIQRENWYSSANAQAKSYALAIGFPIALLVFAQVAGPLLTPAPDNSECFFGDLGRGQEAHEPLAVDPRLESMSFQLQVEQVNGGPLRWFVQDPTGQSRWSGREETPGTFSSGPIPATGGQWMINVISEAESASYNLAWRGAAAGEQVPSVVCVRLARPSPIA